MIALPPAPAPAPRRQLLLGTAIAGSAAAMMVAGMLAIWWRFREASPLREGNDKMIADWQPESVHIPMVLANVILFTLVMSCLMAQYAVYAAKRRDRTNTILGLGVTGLTGLAAINGQAALWGRTNVGIAEGRWQLMFFVVTGTFMALLIVGIIYTLVAVFRYLGGRTAEVEVVSAHAVYWYILTAIFIAVWFVVYVTK